jgi:hypothetical protein
MGPLLAALIGLLILLLSLLIWDRPIDYREPTKAQRVVTLDRSSS